MSRPICAEVSHSLFGFAGLSKSKEDGHRDLRQARIKRDMTDIKKLLEVLVERGPFRTTTQKLVSLSTGLVGDDSVNADDAKNVGNAIITSMVGLAVAEFKFSQKDQVRNLASSTYAKTAGGERIELDPQHLYQRILIIGVGQIPLTELLKYELCCLPTSLFNNYCQMRTGDKSELIHHFLKFVPSCIVFQLPNDLQYVIDGGNLLHKFAWPKHSTYSQICDMYVRHIMANYTNALVVFDGYHGSSTKDEAHRRRKGNEVGATIAISPEMRLTMSKKAFLGNEENKQSLIDLLDKEMEKKGIKVDHAESDADYKICMNAVSHATSIPTAVVAEDSVFQLLVHYANVRHSNLYMVTAKNKVCITNLKRKLTPSQAESLLFLHAISGCDTTSRPHGVGKITVLKKFEQLKDSAAIFMSHTSSREDIARAGEKALLEIYGTPKSPNLNAARVEKFQVKVANSSVYVAPEKLPPTTNAASFHSYRTYHQVQAWRGKDLSSLDWGWLDSPNGLIPVRMDQPAAPEQLLKTIKCNCTGRCDTKRCTCRKNGLQCTLACGNCRGNSCPNCQQDNSMDSGDDDDIDDVQE